MAGPNLDIKEPFAKWLAGCNLAEDQDYVRRTDLVFMPQDAKAPDARTIVLLTLDAVRHVIKTNDSARGRALRRHIAGYQMALHDQHLNVLTGPPSFPGITMRMIGDVLRPAVDARSLHASLKAKSRFNDWFNRGVKTYKFLQGHHCEPEKDSYSKMSKTMGRPETNHILTLDAAKQLAMVENNSVGEAHRLYFEPPLVF